MAVSFHAARAALLFDIDGVLAPIVPHAGDACVPDHTQSLLAALRDRYLLVGLVSGPLTNLALALRSEPELPLLTKYE